MEKTRFNNYVKELAKKSPKYINDRELHILSEYTKTGQNIIKKASRYDGYRLEQIYDNPSTAKKAIYDELFFFYAQTEGADSFSICSHNAQSFSVSWVEPGKIVYITKNHEYHVICDE